MSRDVQCMIFIKDFIFKEMARFAYNEILQNLKILSESILNNKYRIVQRSTYFLKALTLFIGQLFPPTRHITLNLVENLLKVCCNAKEQVIQQKEQYFLMLLNAQKTISDFRVLVLSSTGALDLPDHPTHPYR